MKRKCTLSLILVTLLICLLAGCSSNNPGNVAATSTPATDGGILNDVPLNPTRL